MQTARLNGFTSLGWREVPVDNSSLGDSALATEPRIEQWFVHRSNKMNCLLYTSPSPRDRQKSRMPSSA